MAAPILITRDNYTTYLRRSTNPRGSTPDGNVYIDAANDQIQLIDITENPTVDIGSGLEANALTNLTKVEVLALYFFVLAEVEADPSLQNFRNALDAVVNRMGKLVGATAFLNAVKLAAGAVDISGVGGSLGDDRLKVANSGYTEFASDGSIDRVIHGAKGVNNIEPTSQPYYLLAADGTEASRQAATPVNFSQLGQVNEGVQTFGSTANGDTGAGDFDSRASRLILDVRTFGNLHGETSNADVGVTELGAYAQGYPLNESVNDLLDGIVEADVWGGAQAAPYTGMSFAILAAPQVETGFNEADGNFSRIISNSGGGTLNELVAWADKFSEQDTDQNSNTGVTGPFLPRRAEVLYSIVNGVVVWRQGIYPESIPASDEQRTSFIDDAGDAKTRPFNVGIVIFISQAWLDDSAPWFRLMYSNGAALADFNTVGAVTALDALSVAIAGNNLDARIFAVAGGAELRITYAYDGNTDAGLAAGVDKDMIFQLGGVDSTKRRTVGFTITRSAQINIDASTEAETN